ncbi:MAG: hypothetical protein ACE5KZ_16115 [Candidatus Scalinduaceae bacterium]
MTAYISHRKTLHVYMILSLLLIEGCTGGMNLKGEQFIPRKLSGTPKEELMEIVVNDRPPKMEIDGTRLALPLGALKHVYLKPGEHVTTWEYTSGVRVPEPPKLFSGKAGHTYSTNQILPKNILLWPTDLNIRTQRYIQERLSNANTVAFVTDACIEQDASIKEDYIVIEESKTAAKLMLEHAKQYLEVEKGYDIQFSTTPFIGAFKDPQMNYHVAPNVGDKVKEVKIPFYCDQLIISESEFRDALVKVIRAVFNSVRKKIERQKGTYPTPLPIEEDIQADFTVIRDKCSSDFLIVLVANGRKVPMGKSFAEGMVTGMVSGLLTGGPSHSHVSVQSWHVSFLDTYVGVLDLSRGEVVWSNSLRHKINPTNEKFYTKNWALDLLFHLPGTN